MGNLYVMGSDRWDRKVLTWWLYCDTANHETLYN
jgi:hypothetical protein